MPENISLEKMLVVTNPVWLWFFAHGWEDPGWGKTPISQVVIASCIHELSNRLTDTVLREQVHAVAAKAISQAASAMSVERR